MKISTIALTQFRNDLHFQFQSDFGALVGTFGAACEDSSRHLREYREEADAKADVGGAESVGRWLLRSPPKTAVVIP
jgi:hypothetical protein